MKKFNVFQWMESLHLHRPCRWDPFFSEAVNAWSSALSSVGKMDCVTPTAKHIKINECNNEFIEVNNIIRPFRSNIFCGRFFQSSTSGLLVMFFVMFWSVTFFFRRKHTLTQMPLVLFTSFQASTQWFDIICSTYLNDPYLNRSQNME